MAGSSAELADDPADVARALDAPEPHRGARQGECGDLGLAQTMAAQHQRDCGRRRAGAGLDEQLAGPEADLARRRRSGARQQARRWRLRRQAPARRRGLVRRALGRRSGERRRGEQRAADQGRIAQAGVAAPAIAAAVIARAGRARIARDADRIGATRRDGACAALGGVSRLGMNSLSCASARPGRPASPGREGAKAFAGAFPCRHLTADVETRPNRPPSPSVAAAREKVQTLDVTAAAR